MYYAGIDWADQHHDAVVIDEQGRRVGATRVAHSVAGLEALVTFLRDASGAGGEIACIVETPNGLLVSALLEAELPVYPVNPGTVERKRAPSGAKTDALDAYLLARTGRSDLADLRRLRPDSPLIRELKVLTRDQEMLIEEQTRLVNQLTACLKAYYPVALTFFCKLQQGRTLSFLTAFPTPESVSAATPETILDAMSAAGRPIGAAQAQAIVATLREPHLHADALLTRAKARLMLTLVAQRIASAENLTDGRVLPHEIAYRPDPTKGCPTPACGAPRARPLCLSMTRHSGRGLVIRRRMSRHCPSVHLARVLDRRGCGGIARTARTSLEPRSRRTPEKGCAGALLPYRQQVAGSCRWPRPRPPP